MSNKGEVGAARIMPIFWNTGKKDHTDCSSDELGTPNPMGLHRFHFLQTIGLFLEVVLLIGLSDQVETTFSRNWDNSSLSPPKISIKLDRMTRWLFLNADRVEINAGIGIHV